MTFNSRFFRSFLFAAQGVVHTLKSETNLRFHLVAAAYVLYFSRFYSLQKVERAALYLTIGFVFSAELLNTAVEHAVNLSTNGHQHPLAKLAKDASAGAVLVAAVCSVFVGVCLFGDAAVLLQIWRYLFGSLPHAIIFTGSVILGLLFIFRAPCKGNCKQEEQE